MSVHECPYPGCAEQVDASRLACRRHWYALPKDVRDRIWASYKPDQTILTASGEYLDALQDAMAAWTAQAEGVTA